MLQLYNKQHTTHWVSHHEATLHNHSMHTELRITKHCTSNNPLQLHQHFNRLHILQHLSTKPRDGAAHICHISITMSKTQTENTLQTEYSRKCYC